jgi:hypothetical protein
MAMPIPMVAAMANMSVLIIIFISFALQLRNTLARREVAVRGLDAS